MADDDAFVDESVFIQGPSFHVDLSGLDARHPVHYSDRLYIFRCGSATQREAQLAALKSGLRALLQRCPVLGGLVVPLSPDEAKVGKEDWRTIVPDEGLELVVKDLRGSMRSFDELEIAGFPPSELPSAHLTPIPHDLGNERPFSACKVQFSAIQGGTIITFAMSHSVADGVGNNELILVLSEEIVASENPECGISEATSTLPPKIGLDRSSILNLKSATPFRIRDHPAYELKVPGSKPSQPSESAGPHPFEAPLPEIPLLFRIPTSKLTQLKADATDLEDDPISTHDALSALIWRSVILIRSRRSAAAQEVPASPKSNLFMPSDARKHVDLSQSYIGNAVYQLAAALDIGILLSSSGFQVAAGMIRRTIRAVNPDRVASLLSETNERWLDWQFMNSYSTTGVGMGTDWTSGSVYNEDWGAAFGKVASFRYPGGPGNCILPKLPDGSAECVVSVMPDEIEVLKGMECFGKYVEV